MAVSDWSTTPSTNTNISGINIAENCPAGNLNNAFRQMMADVKVAFNGVPAGSTYLPIAGGALTGLVTRQGAGALLWHADSANQSGRVFIQPLGSPAPTMSNGDILLEY